MRKFMVIALPTVTLILFVAIMLSGVYLKKFPGKSNIPEIIDTVIAEVLEENWEEASKKTENLDATWQKLVKKIQFSAERNEINSFNSAIARLRGAILAQDRVEALIELHEANEHWNQLAN